MSTRVHLPNPPFSGFPERIRISFLYDFILFWNAKPTKMGRKKSHFLVKSIEMYFEFSCHMVSYFGSLPREYLTKLATLVQSFQIRPNSHYVHLPQPLLFIISATKTTGYVKRPSNFYHQLLIHHPHPMPGRPRGVKLVYHPTEIKPLTLLSFTKSCCQKKIIHWLWLVGRKREKTSLERKIAEKEAKIVAFAPWADGDSQVPSYSLPQIYTLRSVW